MVFFGKNKWPNITLEEIRKRARIIVIDDNDFPYRTLFQRDGYTIEKWDDVEDLPKLESGYFDIVLLDIQGVGKEQSQEQGLGILRHLRQVCPAQILVAYSNADYSLKYQDFFKLADRTLAKSADYVEYKRVVDWLLSQRFSLGFYVDRIANLASPHINNIEKLKGLSSKAILNRKLTKVEKYLNTVMDNKDVITMVLQVLKVAIGIASL
jgi:hypothetical protein